MLTDLLLLGAAAVFVPHLYRAFDFAAAGKGVIIPMDILTGITTGIITPAILSFTRWNTVYPKDVSTASEVYGYPTGYLPRKGGEYLLYCK